MKTCHHAPAVGIGAIAHPASEEERRRLPPPPGPKGRLRNVYPRLFAFPEFIHRLQREYGDIVLFRLPWEDVCIVSDPVLAADVLAQEGGLFVQGMPAVEMPRLPNRGLQALDGEAYRWRRAILGPPFSDAGMDAHEDMLVERVLSLQKGWRPGDEIEMTGKLMELTGAIAIGMIFGRDLNPDLGIAGEVRRAVKYDLIVNFLPFSRLLRKLPLRAMRDVESVFRRFDSMVEAAVERSRDPSFEGRDLITCMVRGRGGNGEERSYTPPEIRDELYMMLGGAVGPPATSLCWCLRHVADNPRARERLEAEADEVLGGRPIAPLDHKRLPYAAAVVKETLRLSPPAFVIDKRATEDCVVGGYLIPKGTRVYPSSGMAHRKERHFERPLEFLPERWLQPSAADLPGHAYFPYGHGFRICLGIEYANRVMAYVLASVAQRWRLEPVSNRPARPEYSIAGPYRIKGGLRMRMTPRT